MYRWDGEIMTLGLNNYVALGWNALKSFTSFFGNKNLDPSVIVWIVTHRCNFQCQHCVSWHDKSDFQVDKLLETAHKIAASRTPIVNLSGGELLIVPNIREIIHTLKQAGKFVSVNTNAWLLENHIDFLLEEGVDSITISIDGHTAEIHDGIRKKGSLEKIIKNIEQIKEKRKGNKPFIGIRGVVMQQNMHTLEDYIERFKELGDDIKFQPVHDYEDSLLHAVTNKDMLLQNEQRSELEKLFRKLGEKYPFMNDEYHQTFPEFLFDKEKMKTISPLHCLPVLYLAMRIEPDGNCYTCSQDIGNIYEQSLQEVWASEKRKEFLKNLAKCGTCETPCWLNSNVVSSTVPGKVLKFMIAKGY